MPDDVTYLEPSATREADAVLDGKVAVVTGSGRGIGRAHAMRLAAYGAKVVVNDLGVNTDGTKAEEQPADAVVAEIRAAGGDAVADGNDIVRRWLSSDGAVCRSMETTSPAMKRQSVRFSAGNLCALHRSRRERRP